jgi:hypothetical protein
VRLRRGLRIEHHLRHTLAIAQVDEHDGAVVTADLHPAEKNDFFADVGGAQSAAMVGSF